MEGWISLHRKIMDHPEYFSEPFTRMGAWIDLLLLANHRTGYIRKRGIRVEVLRGQTVVSRERLAERWKWSAGKVTRFLNELETDGQIVQQKSNVVNCITICNYNEYQQNDTTNYTTNERPDSTADHTVNDLQTDGRESANDLQTDVNNNINNVNKGDKDTHTMNNEDNILLTRAQNFLKWIESDYPSIQKMKEPFTLDQALKIVRFYRAEDVGRIVAALYNKGATVNISAYATFCSFADNDRLLKERRERETKLYSYNDMMLLVTSGKAARSDFVAVEKEGLRCFVLKVDYIRAKS